MEGELKFSSKIFPVISYQNFVLFNRLSKKFRNLNLELSFLFKIYWSDNFSELSLTFSHFSKITKGCCKNQFCIIS